MLITVFLFFFETANSFKLSALIRRDKQVRLPLTPNHREPGLCTAFAEGEFFEVRPDLDPDRRDRFHDPAFGERVLQLLLGYETRAIRSRRLVAETQKKDPPARLKNGPQTCHVL